MATNADKSHIAVIEAVQREARAVKSHANRGTALAVSVFVVAIGAIEFFLWTLEVPEWLLPRPSVIAIAWISEFDTVVLPHSGFTLVEVTVGFISGAVVGISLGALIAEFRTLDKVLSPFILILITTPVVALVPLLMLWFGYGIETKIIAAAIASFAPIMMNTISGLSKTPVMHDDLMVYFGASRWQTFRHVRIYNALPSIFTGLIIGSIFALITTVAAEFVGGSIGLGNRLIYYASTLQTPLMFAIILTIAAVGMSLYLGISYLSKRVVTWQH